MKVINWAISNGNMVWRATPSMLSLLSNGASCYECQNDVVCFRCGLSGYTHGLGILEWVTVGQVYAVIWLLMELLCMLWLYAVIWLWGVGTCWYRTFRILILYVNLILSDWRGLNLESCFESSRITSSLHVSSSSAKKLVTALKTANGRVTDSDGIIKEQVRFL